ncbi:ABC transporter ATP-binding protein [Lactonifactor longoviformis]|uniref:Putative ABC transport system ATP-binding protein n=1 Tax=Lactonifactor longoviformis DSM 17459 TaxID=1122155 RepID=A0A1M4ZG23_9CLOT|nr:ABC transporter ATP-binding protein [Lactonifactor longoviformis]POP34561.1 ABC transporter ATP-binding protein [Lactonifactor longoviformis]SHF16980.1 putative ABC transport system ATP-binding protein [Lactonifactor longoviformis DSM 17459]
MEICVNGVSKIYGKGESQIIALDQADMVIGETDFLSIMGPSGSGKSTLLHIISGLDTPTRGTVTYNGRNIHRGSDKELSALRRQKVGFVFQQFHLLPVLTVRENILMPLLLDRRKPDEEYLSFLMEILGLKNRLDHLPGQLSGGQKQRAAIARALSAKPEIIFADEPTGNLDSRNGKEVMELLLAIHREMKKALVIITHDPRIAEQAGRQFVMADGILREVERL